MVKEERILKGPALLKHSEDNWQTDMGAWFAGERVVLRGKDLFVELANNRWMEFMVFAITGRESKKIARLIEAIWVISTSYPDPRLWNNRIAALGGTARTTGSLAVNAASAASEATTYGLRTSKGAIDLLHRFKNKLDSGSRLEDLVLTELKRYRVVWGYGRPLIRNDERIVPLMNFAKSIGSGDGPFVKLAFEINDYLSNSRYKYKINISAVAAALLADEGLSIEEFYYVAALSFTGGIFPCYIDARNQPQGNFFPLSTARINYTGSHIKRKWLTGAYQ
ncbi:MAG: hypothetical protein JKY48_08200 [Flavobacteriales bacterium]|nr:hypothetical protein [Flavobacteriales bacterium]